jgi:hypothetical protein
MRMTRHPGSDSQISHAADRAQGGSFWKFRSQSADHPLGARNSRVIRHSFGRSALHLMCAGVREWVGGGGGVFVAGG